MYLMNKDFMEYLNEEHVRLVLQKLQDHILYTKLSKCEFWMKQVSFLSHIISEEGMFMDSSKIRDMLKLECLDSVADICSLLGLVGYYQRFVKGFSKITKPMIELHGRTNSLGRRTPVKLVFRS
jgi:hypothetical protein